MSRTGHELTSLNDITYTYDANGLRTSKTLASGKKTEYYYSGDTLMFEHREISYNGQPDGDDACRLKEIFQPQKTACGSVSMTRIL